MTLRGKTALVTGAGSGIGKAIAERFAEDGAYVIVNDVNESARAVADSIGGAFLRADLADMDQTRELAEATLALRDGVDVLVNNAGVQYVAPVDEFPEEEWAKLVQIMLIAPFQLTKHLVRGMKARGWGRIVNISSIHGLVASPNKSAYISAKHGLIGFTKSVALETGPYGVTVNAICPSFVRTPLVENQLPDLAEIAGVEVGEVIEKVVLEQAAVKRLIEPDEVAELALFLASDARGRNHRLVLHHRPRLDRAVGRSLSLSAADETTLSPSMDRRQSQQKDSILVGSRLALWGRQQHLKVLTWFESPPGAVTSRQVV